MLSLQILDGREVRSLALDGRVVSVGTGTHCTLRLDADGVASEHARIEPVRGTANYKLIDLGSPAGTRVNGDAVAQVVLSVGDRIEIGAATLVLGKRVQRQTTAKDVLEQGVQVRLRRRAAAPQSSRTPLVLAGGVVLALAAFWWWTADAPPAVLRGVPALLARGDYEAVENILASTDGWAGASPTRRAALQPYVDDLARLKNKIAGLEKQVAATAHEQTAGDQMDALRRSMDRGDVTERAAARRVLARFDDLRRAALAQAASASATTTRESTPQPAVVEAPRERAQSGQTQRSAPEAKPPAQPTGDDLARAREMVERGDYRGAQRLAIAVRDAAGAPTERVAAARELLTRIDTEAARTQAEALSQAEEMVALGQGRNAARMLDVVAERLTDATSSKLRDAVKAIDVTPAAPVAKVDKPLPNPLGDLLKAVEAAESAWNAGDFGRAREQFTAAAEQVKERDAAFGAELLGRAQDAAALSGMHVLVAQRLRDAAKPEVLLAPNQKARLIDCDDAKLRFVGEQGEVTLSWLELKPPVLDAILRAVEAPGSAWVGAALLAVEAGDDSLAESRAVTALLRDDKVKDQADRLIARVRGESVPVGGYVLTGGKLAARAAESAAERELDQKIAAALRQTGAKARDEAMASVLERAPDQIEAVVRVLRRQQRAVAVRLEAHPFKKNFEKVAAERAALDAARKRALELIFDEEHYFYPYRPPAVSTEKASEYLVVQRDVDERVGAVRAIWQGSKLQFKIPAAIAEDVERFRWLTTQLERFGERTLSLTSRARWVETLPRHDTLTVQTFCVSAEEVEKLALAERIHKLNSKRAPSLSPGERTQLEVTNKYRQMMGRQPLAIDLRLLVAARGHGEEMERLSYFGHMSPVPERRSPYDRMRLAGYAHGGSENLASNDSAEGAHEAWLHSSGHHRNVLGPGHTEFACGQHGRLWTQNFGGGRDFERELPE